jgi:hypothetical protein
MPIKLMRSMASLMPNARVLTTMLKFLRHADRAERIAERDAQPGVFSEPPDLGGTGSWKVSQKRICTLHKVASHDTVSERLRRWTRNPLGSARRGSNPIGVAFCLVLGTPACQL